jgi:hypothetical protein
LVLSLLYDHYPTVTGWVIGLLLIFWPPPKQAGEEQMRQTRLAELRGGAKERYFEERRELEAYGPNSAGPFRLWGFLILILSSVPLIL